MIRHFLQVANLFSSKPPQRWRDELAQAIDEVRAADLEAAMRLASSPRRRPRR